MLLFVLVVALLRQVVGWNAQSVIQSLSRTLISPKCGTIYFNDKQINVNGHARASFRHPSRLVISSTRLYNKRSIKDDGIKSDGEPPLSFRRALLASTLAATTELIFSQQYVRPGFKRLKPTRFIAALGDPQTSEGTGAESWGLWERDPGPRGIPFDQFDEYSSSNGRVAPTGWEIDNQDFWLEEHGIWMETPKYDLSPGKYLVTGGRYQTNVFNISTRRRKWKQKMVSRQRSTVRCHTFAMSVGSIHCRRRTRWITASSEERRLSSQAWCGDAGCKRM